MKMNDAQRVEWTDWKHYDVYKFFEHLDFPFYHLTFPVDVTVLKQYTKQHNLSFYLSMVYYVMEALNQVENFRYRIREGELWLLDELQPSFTFLKQGNENFQIVVCRMKHGVEEFCNYAGHKMESQEEFIRFDEPVSSDAFVYLSCLPWLELTSVSNERNIDVNDAIPRITWGKYVEQDGRLRLNLSIEVNHKFADGYHVARFYDILQAKINALREKNGSQKD